MANITANMDSVFDGVSDNQLDFDTIFDSEDSLIDTVEGTNESGIPITTAMAIDSLRESGFMDEADLLTDVNKSEGDGRIPGEPTTDEGTGKNQSPEGAEDDQFNDSIEGMKSAIPGTGNSSESNADCDKKAETALSNESVDIDTLLAEDDLDAILGESDDFPDEAGQKKLDQEIADKQKSDAQDAADANAQRSLAQDESFDLDAILGESDDMAGDASDDTSDDDAEESCKEDVDFDLDTVLGESDDDTDASDDTSDDDTEESCKEEAEPKDEGILADDDSREGDADTEGCANEEVDLDVVLGSPETKTDSNQIAQSCPDCVPNGDSNLDDAEGAAKGTDIDELLGNNEEGIKKSQAPGNHQGVMDLTDDEKKLSESIVVDWSNTHVLKEDDVHDMAKEDDTTDDLDIALADSPDPKSSKNLDYRAGEDDELIDLAMSDNK